MKTIVRFWIFLVSDSKRPLVFFAVLSFLAFYFFKEALAFNIVDDSLLALSFGTRSIASLFSNNFMTFFPSYRPLGQLSLWIQYQIFGVSATWTYFLVNALLWVLCSVISGLFIFKYTKSNLISLLFAALLLLDNRAFAFVSWLTERQNLLMILFGLIAMVWTQKITESKQVPIRSIIGIGLLLLGTALSKEYGIAFSLAIVTYIFYAKQIQLRRLYLAPVSAIMVYILIRAWVAVPFGDIVGKYCEDMGFFFKQQQICYYSQPLFGKLSQYGYNIAASLVGAFLPSLFNEYGRVVEFSTINYVQLFFNFVVAWLFWRSRKQWSVMWFLLFLIIWSSTLGFMVYRTRNQFVSIAPIYIGAGVGLALYMKNLKKDKFIVRAVFGYFLVWVITFGLTMAQQLKKLHDYYNAGWICGTLRSYPRDVSTEVVHKLGVKYGIVTDGCIREVQNILKDAKSTN